MQAAYDTSGGRYGKSQKAGKTGRRLAGSKSSKSSTGKSSKAGESSLDCASNEVTSKLVSWDGPAECIRGDFIEVTITLDLDFVTGRRDFAIYTALDSLDAINGHKCALDIFGEEEKANQTNVDDLDSDVCYDIVQGFSFLGYQQRTLRVLCNSEESEGDTVAIHNCFSWRKEEEDMGCATNGAVPGSLLVSAFVSCVCVGERDELVAEHLMDSG